MREQTDENLLVVKMDPPGYRVETVLGTGKHTRAPASQVPFLRRNASS